MLALHYTGMPSAEEALARLCDPASKVSAHYCVEENGTVHALVDEDRRAWHAGVSCWRGERDVNAVSIGVEIVNPGHEFGYRPFPEAQMAVVTALCADIARRHAIPARNVVGHSDIAPERKEDPGELFDWKRLAKAGAGLWPEIGGSETRGQESGNFREKMAAYGYCLTGDPGQEKQVIAAFQRHFRPAGLTGRWDAECSIILDKLLGML